MARRSTVENPDIDCARTLVTNVLEANVCGPWVNCVCAIVSPTNEDTLTRLFEFIKRNGGVTRESLTKCGPDGRHALVYAARAYGPSFNIFLRQPTVAQGGVFDWSVPDRNNLTPFVAIVQQFEESQIDYLSLDERCHSIVRALPDEALEPPSHPASPKPHNQWRNFQVFRISSRIWGNN
jgi:hypothetical protein